MCGIVGYVGPGRDERALQVIVEGLARLEYRGYDSAGVALVADGRIDWRLAFHAGGPVLPGFQRRAEFVF